jgi:hypothetical protein
MLTESICTRSLVVSMAWTSVLLLTENVADRPGHVGRRERRGRDLVQQRLEAMVVLSVDHGDLERRAAQRFRGFDPAETRADNDDRRLSDISEARRRWHDARHTGMSNVGYGDCRRVLEDASEAQRGRAGTRRGIRVG